MEENEKIYLIDKPIKDISQDEFDYKCIVDEIVQNIKNNEPPYNIALIGKWGTGKSSILDCVEKELKKENKYLFTTINAWKYEKQELRKSFILDIIKKIPVTNKKYEERINEILESLKSSLFLNIKEQEEKKEEKWYAKIGKCLLNILIQSFVMILPLIIMYVVSYYIIDWVLDSNEIKIDDYNSIRLSQVLAFIMTILIEIKNIIKNSFFGKKPININIKEEEKDSNFYEEQLKNTINLYKEKKGKEEFKSIICVVEDIDRLNADKMVEAICALKSFIGIENLIFIVPYDTNILTGVLEECRNNKLSTNYEILEGELILNKLFQFKIYMPELIQEDMYEYAKKLLEKENKAIYKLFPSKEILVNNVLPILIYEGVKTPREVKQLINSFIVKYKIAISREIFDINSFDINLAQLLALITVLECDFNEFYSKIIHYPNIIKEFLKITETSIEENEIASIYKELQKTYKRLKFNELITFLNYTSVIETQNIERLIYLNDSKIDKVAGGVNSKKFRESLKNGIFTEAIELAKKIIDLSDIISREIIYNQGNYLRSQNIIMTTIKLYKEITNNDEKVKIRELIEQNINKIQPEQYGRVGFEDLATIIKDDLLSQCKNVRKLFLSNIKSWKPVYYVEENYDEKDFLESDLEMIISTYNIVEEDIKEKIKNLFNKIGKYNLTEEDASNGLKIYTFMDFYNFIKSKLTVNNYKIFGEEFLLNIMSNIKAKKIQFDDLSKVKNIYKEDKNIDEFIEIVINELKDEETIEIIKLLRIIENDIKDVSEENKRKIYSLIEDNKNNLKSLNDGKLGFLDNIMKEIILDIIKDDENNDVDPLLLILNQTLYIDETIRVIATNNYLEKIPNTMLQINQEIVDEDEKYLEMLKKVHKKYSEELKKDVFEKLYKKLLNSKENIDKLKEVFNIFNGVANTSLCKEFLEKIVLYLENKCSSIEKTKRENIIYFCVENINLMDQRKIDEFFKFVNEKIFVLDQQFALEISKNERLDNIDDELWSETIKKYLKAAKLNLLDYIDIVIKKINVLNNDDELKELYIEKVINNFIKDERILKSLAELNIKEIDSIYSIYEKLAQYNEENIIESMSKIVDKTENIESLIEKILNDSLNLELLIKVISNSSKKEKEDIIINLAEKSVGKKDYTQQFKIGLLEIISKCFNGKKKFKELFISLLIDVLNLLEVEDIEKVIDIIIPNMRILDKESKKTILSKLEVTLERVTEEEKEKINSKIIDLRN